jgi:hypothetical protein
LGGTGRRVLSLRPAWATERERERERERKKERKKEVGGAQGPQKAEGQKALLDTIPLPDDRTVVAE